MRALDCVVQATVHLQGCTARMPYITTWRWVHHVVRTCSCASVYSMHATRANTAWTRWCRFGMLSCMCVGVHSTTGRRKHLTAGAAYPNKVREPPGSVLCAVAYDVHTAKQHGMC